MTIKTAIKVPPTLSFKTTVSATRTEITHPVAYMPRGSVLDRAREGLQKSRGPYTFSSSPRALNSNRKFIRGDFG